MGALRYKIENDEIVNLRWKLNRSSLFFEATFRQIFNNKLKNGSLTLVPRLLRKTVVRSHRPWRALSWLLRTSKWKSWFLQSSETFLFTFYFVRRKRAGARKKLPKYSRLWLNHHISFLSFFSQTKAIMTILRRSQYYDIIFQKI